MAKKNEQTALVAPQEDESVALASALEGFDFGLNDGLQETDSDDLRLPVIVMNMKGKRGDGDQHDLRDFYDTLNEKPFRTMRVAFIHLHKSNAFVRFDQEKNENVYVCSSNDRVTAHLRVNHPTLDLKAGAERHCEGCPDTNWYKNDKGKNIRNCDVHYGVFAVHLDEDLRPVDGFLIRFKRTNLPPFKAHMQKHHLGRRPLPNGQRGNVPLFVFAVNMKLEVAENGNYATPVLERGPVLPRETIQILAEQAKYFAELGDEATKAAEKAERAEGGENAGGSSGGLRESDFVD